MSENCILLKNEVIDMLRAASVGDDHSCDNGDFSTAGITVNEHINAVEIHADRLGKAKCIRDVILNIPSDVDDLTAKCAELEKERDSLKAKCAELGESLQGMCDSIVNEEGMYLRKWNSRYRVPTGKALAVMSKEPEICLAEIERAAIYRAVEQVLRRDFSKRPRHMVGLRGSEIRGLFDEELCDYADNLVKQAGGSEQ